MGDAPRMGPVAAGLDGGVNCAITERVQTCVAMRAIVARRAHASVIRTTKAMIVPSHTTGKDLVRPAIAVSDVPFSA